MDQLLYCITQSCENLYPCEKKPFKYRKIKNKYPRRLLIPKINASIAKCYTCILSFSLEHSKRSI